MKNYITSYDPFFERFFLGERKSDVTHMMKTNIKENKDAYEMKIELPDVKKENIKLSLDKGYLTIKATLDDEEDNGEFLFKEITTGEFSRSYYVGNNVKFDDISAKLDSGVLRVSIAKRKEEPEANHFIEIQ